MTVATLPPVVTVTNVRTAAPELGPLVAPAPWVDNHPHPCARPDDRSMLARAWDDQAVRWLGWTGCVGVALSLTLPTWVWWALVPWSVALWHNHRRHGLAWAKHRRSGQ